MKYGQGHQPWQELLDPKQGSNQKQFERPPLNHVHQRANFQVLVKSENMSIISLKYVQKWKIVVYSLSIWPSLQSTKFNLKG